MAFTSINFQEKAASWDPERDKQRLYPWGDEFDSTKCNVQEQGTGDTTPIGTFSPAGDSFYGVAEMYGNIREWTATPWEPEARVSTLAERSGIAMVVRGKSWTRISTWGRIACIANPAPMTNSFLSVPARILEMTVGL
jgi:formylglycine-generating enzyme required for sulfatase activity